MALKNRYIIMSDSEDGVFKDPLSFPVEKFTFEYYFKEYKLSEADVERFHLFVYNYYGSSSYRDILLIINGVDFVGNLAVGQKIILPHKKDLDNFYNKIILAGG